MSDVNICHLTLKFSEYCTFTNVKVRENRWEGCVSVTYEYYLGAERVLQYMCCDDVTGILPPPHLCSVPSFPLPPFRGRKVMTTLLIIISSFFICLAASSCHTHTNTLSHAHCQTCTHCISTRTCRQNGFTYSERRRAARPGPFIIHTPECIDFSA